MDNRTIVYQKPNPWQCHNFSFGRKGVVRTCLQFIDNYPGNSYGNTYVIGGGRSDSGSPKGSSGLNDFPPN